MADAIAFKKPGPIPTGVLMAPKHDKIRRDLVSRVEIAFARFLADLEDFSWVYDERNKTTVNFEANEKLDREIFNDLLTLITPEGWGVKSQSNEQHFTITFDPPHPLRSSDPTPEDMPSILKRRCKLFLTDFISDPNLLAVTSDGQSHVITFVSAKNLLDNPLELERFQDNFGLVKPLGLIPDIKINKKTNEVVISFDQPQKQAQAKTPEVEPSSPKAAAMPPSPPLLIGSAFPIPRPRPRTASISGQMPRPRTASISKQPVRGFTPTPPPSEDHRTTPVSAPPTLPTIDATSIEATN